MFCHKDFLTIRIWGLCQSFCLYMARFVGRNVFVLLSFKLLFFARTRLIVLWAHFYCILFLLACSFTFSFIREISILHLFSHSYSFNYTYLFIFSAGFLPQFLFVHILTISPQSFNGEVSLWSSSFLFFFLSFFWGGEYAITIK